MGRMKSFDYQNTTINKKNLKLLDEIKKSQGKLEMLEDTLTESTFEEAYFSNKIEGIILDYKKCKNLKDLHGKPGDVSDFEQQFIGYKNVLKTIQQKPNLFDCNTTSVLAMVYALFNIPADYKKSIYRKNDYQEMYNEGQITRVRVSPVDAYETPLYIGSAITALNDSFENNPQAALLNIAKFLVDFMCIRPFDVGCGRIARLFTYLLLLKNDVSIQKYISLSKVFEANASLYYESISRCCQGWDEGANNYEPFITYYLKCILKAYNILLSKDVKLNKFERIRNYFKDKDKEINKAELVNAFPDISLSTIENALHKLKNEGKIKQIGGGRSTRYKNINQFAYKMYNNK